MILAFFFVAYKKDISIREKKGAARGSSPTI